ncbi:hypothetical protein VNO77_37289 [Canavalia gladiata]|uniref:Uncharacterized protein n=1 Tax=Canavalia gladiata TaxID=3824 RepID=A0AAN9KAP0_CANGL
MYRPFGKGPQPVRRSRNVLWKVGNDFELLRKVGKTHACSLAMHKIRELVVSIEGRTRVIQFRNQNLHEDLLKWQLKPIASLVDIYMRLISSTRHVREGQPPYLVDEASSMQTVGGGLSPNQTTPSSLFLRTQTLRNMHQDQRGYGVEGSLPEPLCTSSNGKRGESILLAVCGGDQGKFKIFVDINQLSASGLGSVCHSSDHIGCKIRPCKQPCNSGSRWENHIKASKRQARFIIWAPWTVQTRMKKFQGIPMTRLNAACHDLHTSPPRDYKVELEFSQWDMSKIN